MRASRKKKILPPRVYPPEGRMLYDNKEVDIAEVESSARNRMEHWDRYKRLLGTTLVYWSQDKSYNWNRRPHKKRKI